MNESLVNLALDTERLLISDVKQIRPWVRFWARLIDIFVGIILVTLLAVIFIPRALTLNYVFTNFIVLVFLMLPEALLLSTWGM